MEHRSQSWALATTQPKWPPMGRRMSMGHGNEAIAAAIIDVAAKAACKQAFEAE